RRRPSTSSISPGVDDSLARKHGWLSGPPRKLTRESCLVGLELADPGCGVVEVESAGTVEGFFWGAGEAAAGQDGFFVPVFAGQVAGESPGVRRSVVAQPAQREGTVSVGAGDVGVVSAVAHLDLAQVRPSFASM